MSGDAACDFDLRELMRGHERSGAAVSVALCECPEPLRYGVAVPDEKLGSALLCGEAGLGPRRLRPREHGHLRHKPARHGLRARGAGVRLRQRPLPAAARARRADTRRAARGLLVRRGHARAHTISAASTPWTGSCGSRAWRASSRRRPARAPSVSVPLPWESAGARRVSCRDRARLMRALSLGLAECGADFTDGLTLGSEHCRARIRPAADDERGGNRGRRARPGPSPDAWPTPWPAWPRRRRPEAGWTRGARGAKDLPDAAAIHRRKNFL